MPRKVRRRRRSRAGDAGPLLEGIRQGLPWDRPDRDQDLNFKLLELLWGHDHFGLGFAGDDMIRQQAWESVRDEFLAAHIARFPGSRPWAWWYYDSPKPRKILRGDAFKSPSSVMWFGMPSAYGGDAVFESSGKYLRRLKLVLPGEKFRAAKEEPPDPATAYALTVTSGQQVACQKMQWSCQRHLDDLTEAHERDLYFDRQAADRRLKFAYYIRHFKGRWGHGQGDLYEPQRWQQFCTGSIFGWKRANGLRRFRSASRWVARKNGKTFVMAEDGLYGLTADGEAGPEIYFAATKRDQARIAFRGAIAMRKRSPALSLVTKQIRDRIMVTGEEESSFSTPLGEDSHTEDGLNPSQANLDEVHAHPDRSMRDVLDSAMGARDEPLLNMISTAGFNSHGFGKEEYDYASQVLDPNTPVENDAYFAAIFELDDEEEIEDEKAWVKPNPNLGVSVSKEYLRTKVREMKDRAGVRNNVLVKHFNIWTSSEEGWLSMEKWAACAGTTDPVGWRQEMLEALKGRPCYGGLDLSTKLDLTAFVLYFPEEEISVALPFFWVPEKTLQERVRRDRVPYDVWRDQEFLEATPGDVIDYEYIRATIFQLAEDYDLREVAYDPWNAGETALRLNEGGVTVAKCRQGYATLSEPSKDFEAKVASSGFIHGGNPVLGWNASNVAIQTDPAGNIKPSKEGAQRNRIDGIVALIMALWRSMFAAADESNEIQQGVLLL